MSELSFNEIRGLLEQTLNADQGTGIDKGIWVIDVYSNWFVYQDYGNSGTYKRDYAIGTDGKITLGEPVKVIENKTYVTVQTAAFDLNGDYEETESEVILEGLIFKAGEYPDKGYSMTPEEILTAIEKFTPQPVDDSHNDRSIFKGKMGQIREVFSPDNGQTMHGKVALPKWVDKAMGAIPRTVSCTWDRATKLMAGLALTSTPRIEDAVLYAAFMENQEEKQKQAEFEGKRNNAADHSTIQKIHDHTASLGAKCSGDNAEYSSDKNPNETDKELDKTMSEVNFKDTQEFKDMQAQFTAQQAELDQIKKEKRHLLAETTVEVLAVNKKILPVEKKDLISVFEKALEDDAVHPGKVTFGQGQEVTRFDALKTLYDARPALPIYGESFPQGGQLLTSNFSQGSSGEEVSQERLNQLLAQTSVGQGILASFSQNNNGGKQ